MATATLAERVSVLEVRMDSITEIALRAERKADTSMGRQDFLAENLIEVRKTVTRIDETQQQHGVLLLEHSTILREHSTILREHGTILREHSTMLAEHGTMLREQGDLLREILRKLDERQVRQGPSTARAERAPAN